MMLEVSSIVKQAIIAGIFKAITVLGIDLGALHVLTCLIFTTGRRVSTVTVFYKEN